MCWSIRKLVVNNQYKIMIIKLTNRNQCDLRFDLFYSFSFSFSFSIIF